MAIAAFFVSASAALYSSRSFFSVVVSLTEDSEEDAFFLSEDPVEVVFFDVDAFFDAVDVFVDLVDLFSVAVDVFADLVYFFSDSAFALIFAIICRPPFFLNTFLLSV